MHGTALFWFRIESVAVGLFFQKSIFYPTERGRLHFARCSLLGSSTSWGSGVPSVMEQHRRMKTAFGGDLAVVGSGCSGGSNCSAASGTAPSSRTAAAGGLAPPTKRTGGLPPALGGSDARILAMLRRQLHGPKHISLVG